MPTLLWKKTDKKLLADVRALNVVGAIWSTGSPIIQAYRSRLLELQNNRCAYCLTPIESTANGFVELDHILPKQSSGKNVQRRSSNAFKDRRVTNGHSKFTFEPKNLVVTCRACNSAKQSFDPHADRQVTLNHYPNGKNIDQIIIWYHPHFHYYGAHIIRNKEWTYSKVSDQGDYTIRACKLHLPKEIQKRFQLRADVALDHSPNVTVAINSLATSILQNRIGMTHAVFALHDRCNLSSDQATALLKIWVEHVSKQTYETLTKANQALQSVALVWEAKESFENSTDQLCQISNAL